MPSKDNFTRQRCIPASNISCSNFCGNLETSKHLFLDCATVSSLWSLVLHLLGISTALGGELRHHFIQFINMASMPRIIHSHLRVIWFSSVWVIRKERNNRVFNNAVSVPSTFLEKIKLNSFLWLKFKHATFSCSYHDWWKHPMLCMGIH